MYIFITLSAYINVSTAFGEKHNRLRDSRLSLVRPSGGLRLVADKTTKNKKIIDLKTALIEIKSFSWPYIRNAVHTPTQTLMIH